MKPLPTGAQMWAKTDKVWDHVFYILEKYPGARGDDRLLEYWHRVIYEGWRPWVKMTNNQAIAMVRHWMSGETLIRRRAEIQNAVEYQVGDQWVDEDAMPKPYVKASAQETLTWRWKYPHLRATERTARKRAAREDGAYDYYTGGQTRLPSHAVPS